MFEHECVYVCQYVLVFSFRAGLDQIGLNSTSDWLNWNSGLALTVSVLEAKALCEPQCSQGLSFDHSLICLRSVFDLSLISYQICQDFLKL